MLARIAGVTAFTACAQVASAFLIPANLEVESQIEPSSLLKASTKHQLVTLPCSDCVFSAKHDVTTEAENNGEPLFFIQGGANSVAVNFTITEDGLRLEANGETIYPMGLQIEDLFKSPKTWVHQVPSSASVKDIENGEARTTPVEVTGHGVSIIEEAVVSEVGDVLIPIKYSIFELERQPVSLDGISVQILKEASGELSIMHIAAIAHRPMPIVYLHDSQSEHSTDDFPIVHFGEAFPPHHSGMHHSRPHKECKMLPASICKLRHMIESKVNGMKKGGCHGKKAGHGKRPSAPGHVRPHFLHPGQDEAPQGHHQGRPHHMRPHSEHQHHGHGHGHGHRHHDDHFMRAFSHGLAAVMIPTLAGVAVGMVVSLIGLLFGRLIGYLWFNFYRGGRRGYASVALDESSSDNAEFEKSVNEKAMPGRCSVEIEVLPVYEEVPAPAYEEAVKEQL